MNDSANSPPTEGTVTLKGNSSEITNLRLKIMGNPLMTKEDFKTAFNDLVLLEFMLTPREGWSLPEIKSMWVHKCEECNHTGTLYRIAGRWLCVDHIPKSEFHPVGCHGEDYKRYKADGKR